MIFCGMTEGVLLLQGPPGTGKITTLVALLLHQQRVKQRTLACAPSNKAMQLLASR